MNKIRYMVYILQVLGLFQVSDINQLGSFAYSKSGGVEKNLDGRILCFEHIYKLFWGQDMVRLLRWKFKAHVVMQERSRST
jgi:hypothetical protein